MMLVDIRHLDKSYVNDNLSTPVLFDINLQVEEGEYLVIMGPSGSGKSTLMNIIGCLDVPTAGEYDLDGNNTAAMNDDALADLRNRAIGFVFQNFNLLPRETALENVALPLLYQGVPRKERLERAEQALRRVGLEERMQFLPTQLSGGQKQRVAIARALVTGPRLLLADEPTGALDTASGKQIMSLFRELNEEGITVIMITHDAEIGRQGKRLVLIRDGRLTAAEENTSEREDEM